MSVSTADAISSEIVGADLIVAIEAHSSTNVSYELGIAQAAGKPVILLVGEEGSARNTIYYPADQIFYNVKSREGLDTLRQDLVKALSDFRRNTNLFRPSTRFIVRPATPLSVDLDRLHPRDAENLCFELLTQMGFRRIEWGVSLKEFDVVATLPKKDPDGFEYNELWLISIGMNRRGELPGLVMRDPEFALRRLELERLPIDLKADVPVTFLFIQTRDSPDFDNLHRDLLRMEMRSRSRRMPYVRIRVWDRQQLVRLIQEYPQLWHKYFAEDGRVRSTTRKSYEALYIEVSELNEKLQATIRALEEEREKRARAERDAVWKEVAFTAAHKLGNPIFALETSLQAIKRRINGKMPDAYKIAVEMEGSIEKAKLIIDQFKSLTRANEIEPRALDLVPLLQSASRVATDTGVNVRIFNESNEAKAMADPARMTECFDELFANALHWLDGDSKEISATVDPPKKNELPAAFRSGGNFVRVRIGDNGRGIPADHKEKVFAPFFTTYPHGTGLGLALVQRVVEGHGGLIREVGGPEEGALFEIFLPRAP